MRKRLVSMLRPRGAETPLARVNPDLLQFRKKYSWDESAFSSGRDGVGSNDGPSCAYIIHPTSPPLLAIVDMAK